MTIFDRIWSKNTSSSKPPLRIDTTQQLKDIFYERKHGEYVGGTLSFKVNEDLVLKIVNRGINEEENFWIAMNYVKYKNNTSFHYNEALDLIINRDDMQKEVAKLFLMG